MNTTVQAANRLTAARSDNRAADAWDELVAAMPIVILVRAMRDVIRQRAHKRAVLAAFRR